MKFVTIVFHSLFSVWFTVAMVIDTDDNIRDMKHMIAEQNKLLKEFQDQLLEIKMELKDEKRINERQSIEIGKLKNLLLYSNAHNKDNVKTTKRLHSVGFNGETQRKTKIQTFLQTPSFISNSTNNRYGNGVRNGRRDKNMENKSRGEAGMVKRLLLPATTTVSPKPPVIAFSTYLTKDYTPVTDDHVLLFDHVQTNHGNGYSRHTGVFTVPSNGTYVFTYTLVIVSNSEVCTYLIINGIINGDSYGYSGSTNVIQTSTSIVVVQVNQGDKVFVRTATDGACGQTGRIYGDTWRRSTFSGWLLG